MHTAAPTDVCVQCLYLFTVTIASSSFDLSPPGTRVSTKKVMIEWLQALLPTWNITNLTTDWNDGRYVNKEHFNDTACS